MLVGALTALCQELERAEVTGGEYCGGNIGPADRPSSCGAIAASGSKRAGRGDGVFSPSNSR